MNMELHSTGASFIAEKSEHNPRDMVIEVVRDMPEASRKERFERFWVSLGDVGVDYHRAVAWYFFVNMHDYLTTSRNRSDPVERTQARAEKSDVVEKIKEQLVLLEFPMTNGKLLGDCTGPELRKLSSRYTKLADRVNNKTVRSVLSEEQVKTILE